MELNSLTLRIDRAKRSATVSTLIFGETPRRGKVSVTTNSVKADALMLSYAFPKVQDA